MIIRDDIKSFGLLCQQVSQEPSLLIKEEIIGGFISRFRGDLGLLLKLLLPKYANRVYYAQDKHLLRTLSVVLSVPEDVLTAELHRNGCVAETARTFFRRKCAVDSDGWCDMSLAAFDHFLDRLAAASTEALRVKVVSDLFLESCAHVVYLFFREAKLDLRLGAGLRVVLNGLHPEAYEIFKHCANVQQVVRRLQEKKRGSARDTRPQQSTAAEGVHANVVDPQGDADTVGTERGRIATEIKLGVPLAPMLAAPSKSIEQVLDKCPRGALSEVKYDGERIQIHKQGSQLIFFARSLRPMRADKYAGIEPFLREAIGCRDCILDGELLMVNLQTSLPLPFGTLGRHKKTQFASACPCVFLFDILYQDGASLLHEPLVKRREALKQAVRAVKNHVMFSELCHIKGDRAQQHVLLQAHLNRAVAEGLEGLVIKDVDGRYEPRARHWRKLKKDYLDGLADSADLLVLGAWYGSGSKGGQLSTFLMGCIDTSVPADAPHRFTTVCRAGNGLDDRAITALTLKYKTRMMSCRGRAIPPWLHCHSLHQPDVVLQDPSEADVMEVIGAEFSAAPVHTSGISIRFPRILRERTDKTVGTATTLAELQQLYRTSKERLSSAGLLDALELADSPGVVEPTNGGDAAASTTVSHAPTATPTLRDTVSPPAFTVEYVRGDATALNAVQPGRAAVLCHAAAVGGRWSPRGVMGAISKAFGPAAARAYDRSSHEQRLGEVIVTEVGAAAAGRRVFVATMLAQAHAPRSQVPPVHPPSLRQCLSQCATLAAQHAAEMVVVQPPPSASMSWSEMDACLRALSSARLPNIVVYGTKPTEVPAAGLSATDSRPTELDKSGDRDITANAGQRAPPWWCTFAGVTAQLVVGDDTRDGHRVASLIEALGGEVVARRHHADAAVRCTHVVLLPAALLSSAGEATSAGRRVTSRWVEDCAHDGVFYAEVLYAPQNSSVLAGCRLFMATTATSRAALQRIAELLGAACHTKWALIEPHSTHCLADGWSDESREVSRLGGRVVRSQWLLDCAAAHEALPVSTYLLPSPAAEEVSPFCRILSELSVGVDAALAPAGFYQRLTKLTAQMGARPCADPSAAQYYVTARQPSSADAVARAEPHTRYVSPAWITSCARHNRLLDPATFVVCGHVTTDDNDADLHNWMPNSPRKQSRSPSTSSTSTETFCGDEEDSPNSVGSPALKTRRNDM